MFVFHFIYGTFHVCVPAVAQWFRRHAISLKIAGRDPKGEWFLSIYPILPAILGPGLYSGANRSEYQKQENNVSGEQSGGRRVRLTNIPPSVSQLCRQCGILNMLHLFTKFNGISKGVRSSGLFGMHSILVCTSFVQFLRFIRRIWDQSEMYSRYTCTWTSAPCPVTGPVVTNAKLRRVRPTSVPPPTKQLRGVHQLTPVLVYRSQNC
jgi:hypothetical protein